MGNAVPDLFAAASVAWCIKVMDFDGAGRAKCEAERMRHFLARHLGNGERF